MHKVPFVAVVVLIQVLNFLQNKNRQFTWTIQRNTTALSAWVDPVVVSEKTSCSPYYEFLWQHYRGFSTVPAERARQMLAQFGLLIVIDAQIAGRY